MFVFVMPAGVGLYYLVSGMFTSAEQFIFHLVDAYRLKTLSV